MPVRLARSEMAGSCLSRYQCEVGINTPALCDPTPRATAPVAEEHSETPLPPYTKECHSLLKPPLQIHCDAVLLRRSFLCCTVYLQTLQSTVSIEQSTVQTEYRTRLLHVYISLSSNVLSWFLAGMLWLLRAKTCACSWDSSIATAATCCRKFNAWDVENTTQQPIFQIKIMFSPRASLYSDLMLKNGAQRL